MNLKQKNTLLIIASTMLAILITIIISGFFPIAVNHWFNANLYVYRDNIPYVIIIAVMCSVTMLLSILFRIELIKRTKEWLITYGVMNLILVFVIIFSVGVARSMPSGLPQFTNNGIFMFVLSIILSVLTFVSACLAFIFSHPLSAHVSPKKALKKKNKKTREAFVKLRSLKELLDDGIITQEEFEEKRKRYLEGL